jgi:hypothetical protein
MVGGLVGILGYIVFSYTGLGSTVMNLPLRIQPQTESGLVGYWSFDTFDIASSTAEVRDDSGNANHGNIVNNASSTDAVVDASMTGTSTMFLGNSPRTVFVSKQNGYTFYPDTDGGCYAASTTDAGVTWGGRTVIDTTNTTDCRRVAVWYDGWTQSFATTATSAKIHIATLETSGSDIYYVEFDFATTGDKFATAVLTNNQGAAVTAHENMLSITRTATGTLFVGLSDNSDRFIFSCAYNCSGATANWSEIQATGPALDAADSMLLLPVPGNNNLMVIHHDASADDYLGRVWSATSSSWTGTTTIDASAVENSIHRAHYGATVNWNSNKIYMVYAADNNDFITADHDLRFASYDAATWTWSQSAIASNIAARSITDAKVAYDQANNTIYAIYAASTTIASTTRIFYRTSTNEGASWSTEQGPIDVESSAKYGGANVSILGENIYNVRLHDSGALDGNILGKSLSAPFGNYAFEEGRVGQGYWFDGVDDYVSMGDPASGLLDLGDQDMTLAAWIYPEEENTFRPIIAKVTSASEKEYALVVQTANQLQFEIETSGNGAAVSSPDNAVPKNQWSHIAATYNDATREVKLYVNGVEQSTSGSILADPVNFAQDLQIGSFDYNGSFFKGGIDEVRIYDRILASDEVSQIYQIGATTKLNTTLTNVPSLESGLLLHYTFDGKDVSSSTDRITSEITDRSGQGNTGDWRNHGSTTKPGRIGSSIEFDGTNDDIDAGSASIIDNLGRSTPMSFAAWIYPNTDGEGDGTYGGVIATKGTGDGWWISMSENPPNALRWTYGCGGTALFKTTAAGTTLTNEWTHVVVTTDGSTEADNTRIYVNGVEQSYFEAIDCGTTLDDDAAFVMTIGGNFGSGSFDGEIDDVRLYNRVLSQSEIALLYGLGGTAKLNTTVETQPLLRDDLVAHWTMDGRDVVTLPTSVTSEIKDRSTQNITLDWIDHASTTMPGIIGQALYLDGTNDYASSTQLPLTVNTIGLSDWTVMVWAKPESFAQSNGTNRTVLSQANANNGTARRWVDIATDGSINTNHGGTTNFMNVQTQLNQWVHIVLRYDDALDRIDYFINGQYTGKKDPASLDGGDGPLLIGVNPATNGGFFQGGIDDVRMYQSIVPTTTIQSIYQLGR